MNNEVLEALNILEKEKNISKDTLIEAIETSLITACKNHFGKSENVRVDMNPETCEYHVFQAKTVVEAVEDPVTEISLANAKMVNSRYELGDVVNIEIKSKEFGRIATQNAKNVILQKIREEERKILCDEYYSKEKDIVTGIVQRYMGRNVSINLGKVDAILTENEQVRGEVFQPTERIKLYILEVKSTSKGPKILVSRTHPELVKRLFESEVAEVKSGIVEIKSIAREAGSRTKIAVHSNDPDVDAVGACVGQNGTRVNAVVKELRGEKIDIITWNDNPAMLIENALSPAKVISVIADAEEKSAKVVVPDYQLSLAIGKEGQNARLAARLTGFKIDIKSETQAREAGDFFDYENDYEDADEYDDYENDAYEQEGSEYERADSEYAQAGTGYEQAGTGYEQESIGCEEADSSYGQADGEYAQEGSEYDQESTGYEQESIGLEQADGKYAQEGSEYDQEGSGYDREYDKEGSGYDREYSQESSDYDHGYAQESAWDSVGYAEQGYDGSGIDVNSLHEADGGIEQEQDLYNEDPQDSQEHYGTEQVQAENGDDGIDTQNSQTADVEYIQSDYEPESSSEESLNEESLNEESSMTDSSVTDQSYETGYDGEDKEGVDPE